MLKGLTKAALTAALLAGSAMTAAAQDFTIRATANSNENDEDYDGLVVFKNHVENASNGRILRWSCSSARSFARAARNVCKVWPTAPSTCS